VPAQFRNWRLTEIRDLFGPYALLLVVGVVGIWVLTLTPGLPGAELVHALLEACAIAGVLGITIELLSAKRLIQHVSNELVGRLTGPHLPKPIGKRIGELVTKTNFVLENYLKAYRFTKCETNEFVEIEITTSYRVVNYSETDLPYVPHLAEEIFYRPVFQKLRYGIPGQDSIAFDAAALARMVEPHDASKARRITGPTQIILPSIRYSTDPVNTYCEVFWQHSVRMPYEYTDVTSFGAPASGITLRIDESLPDLNFEAGGPEMKQTSATSWHSMSGFATNEHVRVWWFRHDSKLLP
jgi:hypothetical protein